MIFEKKQAPVATDSGVVLLLQVPRTNDKKELAAEQMFASLHGLLSSAEKARLFQAPVHERVSFEIAVQKKRIGFYVWVPERLKSFVEEQIYAQYPDVHISEVEDYAKAAEMPASVMAAAELKFTANEALPIKTFPSFEVDPLAAITAALAQFDENEEAWLQVVMRPANEKWHKKSEQYARKKLQLKFPKKHPNLLSSHPSNPSAAARVLAAEGTNSPWKLTPKSRKILPT